MRDLFFISEDSEEAISLAKEYVQKNNLTAAQIRIRRGEGYVKVVEREGFDFLTARCE